MAINQTEINPKEPTRYYKPDGDSVVLQAGQHFLGEGWTTENPLNAPAPTPPSPADTAINNETDNIMGSSTGPRAEADETKKKLEGMANGDGLEDDDTYEDFYETDEINNLTTETDLAFDNMKNLLDSESDLTDEDLKEMEEAADRAGSAYDPLIKEAQEAKRLGMPKAIIRAGERGGFMSTQFAGAAALRTTEGETFTGEGGQLNQIKSQYDDAIFKIKAAKLEAERAAKAAAKRALLTGKKEDTERAVLLYDIAKQKQAEALAMVDKKIQFNDMVTERDRQEKIFTQMQIDWGISADNEEFAKEQREYLTTKLWEDRQINLSKTYRGITEEEAGNYSEDQVLKVKNPIPIVGEDGKTTYEETYWLRALGSSDDVALIQEMKKTYHDVKIDEFSDTYDEAWNRIVNESKIYLDEQKLTEKDYQFIKATGDQAGGVFDPATGEFTPTDIPSESVDLITGEPRKEAILAQISNGLLTKGDATDIRDEFADDPDFLAKVTKAFSDPKNKAVSETQAGKYNAPANITRRQLDEIIQTRQDNGFGNKTFQGVGKKEYQNIVDWLEMEKDINSMRALKEGGDFIKTLSQDEKQRIFDDFKDDLGVDSVEELDNIGKANTGPVASRALKAKELFGAGSERLIAIDIISGKYKTAFMKEISGVAISEPEAIRLGSLVPNIALQDKRFKKSSSDAQDSLNTNLLTAANSFGFNTIDEMREATRKTRAGEYFDLDNQVLEKAMKKVSNDKVKTDITNYKQSIQSAIDSEYTSAEIIDYLKNDPSVNEMINSAKQYNYNDDEIIEYLQNESGNFSMVGGDTNEASKIREAIGQYESGGNYQIRGKEIPSGQYKGERAMGKYQIMPGNLPSWSKQALGRIVSEKEFLNNPDIQDKIAEYKMAKIYEQYGTVEDVASIWFSGQPMAKAGNKKDVLGTSVPTYIKNIQSIYNKLG